MFVVYFKLKTQIQNTFSIALRKQVNNPDTMFSIKVNGYFSSYFLR